MWAAESHRHLEVMEWAALDAILDEESVFVSCVASRHVCVEKRRSALLKSETGKVYETLSLDNNDTIYWGFPAHDPALHLPTHLSDAFEVLGQQLARSV